MLEFLLDGFWLLEGALSNQMGKLHLKYICIFIWRILCVVIILVNIIIPYKSFKHPYCYFTLLSPVFIFLSLPNYILPPHHFFGIIHCFLLVFQPVAVGLPTLHTKCSLQWGKITFVSKSSLYFSIKMNLFNFHLVHFALFDKQRSSWPNPDLFLQS